MGVVYEIEHKASDIVTVAEVYEAFYASAISQGEAVTKTFRDINQKYYDERVPLMVGKFNIQEPDYVFEMMHSSNGDRIGFFIRRTGDIGDPVDPTFQHSEITKLLKMPVKPVVLDEQAFTRQFWEASRKR